MVSIKKQLKDYSTIGKSVTKTPKGQHKGQKKRIKIGEIIDEVSVLESNGEYKNFIQKIKKTNGEITYRICYYTPTNTPTRTKQYISWGDKALMCKEEYLIGLFIKALNKKGFFNSKLKRKLKI